MEARLGERVYLWDSDSGGGRMVKDPHGSLDRVIGVTDRVSSASYLRTTQVLLTELVRVPPPLPPEV